MSQRSIIEINHDFSYNLETFEAQRIFMGMLLHAIASGSDDAWSPLRAFGIRRVTQCHHSDDRKVVVSDVTGIREYPIP